MNKIFKFFPRPSRFLKPGKSLLLLMLFVFCTAAFATPTTPTSDFIDNGDGTVTHKLTGLVWMRCSMGQTWDKATANCTGSAEIYTYNQAVTLTNTFAGKSDWRLPNIAELHTITELENVNPAINTALFPNTNPIHINSNTPDSWNFWSSSPVVGKSDYAWCVSFDFGYEGLGLIRYYGYGYNGYPVRLVRAGQSFGSTATSDFTDNNDGTVTHKRTGLTWQRCSVGQIWTGTTCSGTGTTYTWDAAMALTSDFAGKSDWRVPTQNELLSIAEYGAFGSGINATIFPNTPFDNSFWSASSVALNNGNAWSVAFNGGNDGWDAKYNNDYVRLVRGQWSAPIESNLDMTQAKCRYAAPVYRAMWKLMKTRTAPSCSAVVRYHTWIRSVRNENIDASHYFSNQLEGITSEQEYRAEQLATIDEGLTLMTEVLDPDLRRVLTTPQVYQRTVNIMKSGGLITSLAAGNSPFKLNTLTGRVINKALKDKVISPVASDGMCRMLFNDAATLQSCKTEATKVGKCAGGLATEGWKGASTCILGATTSVASAVNNWLSVLDVINIGHRVNEYILINNYMDDYFAKGSMYVPVDPDLETSIQAYAAKYGFSSTLNWDYNMDYVKKGIRSSLDRVIAESSANIKTTESLRAILNK